MGIGRTPLPTAVRGTLQRSPGRVWFWVGVTMLLLSFATYPAYPLLPFLPISAWQQGGVGIALAAMSWGIFLPQAHRSFWRRERPSAPP